MAAAVRLLLACLACGCGFQVNGGTDPEPDAAVDDDAPPAGPWLSGFSHRKPLTIASPQPQSLPDFVVAVILPADADLAARARDDGRDLAITAADGTTIASFEIEQFDGATGALVAWVNVPTFDGNETLYLYYGGGTEDRMNAELTWPASVFTGVWHLSDATTILAADSTTADHDLTSTGAEIPADTSGNTARARAFDGDRLAVADPADGSLDKGTSSFSYSAWAYVETSLGDYDMVLYKGGSQGGDPGYDLELGRTTWRAFLASATQDRSVTFGNEVDLLNRWVHLVAVVDRSAQRLRTYTNGAFVAEVDITAVVDVDNARGLNVGYPTYPFRGKIDEVRIYAQALSPAWIATEYANLSAPASFVMAGSEEAAP